jgi:hypothetical protein
MSNLKSKIILYHNYLILIWWIIVLIVFRFINNFHFQHGSSVIFLLLFFLPPLWLKLLSFRHRRRIKRQKAARKSGCFVQIKNDVTTSVFQSNLVQPLKGLFGWVQVDEGAAEIVININNQIKIVFDAHKANVSLIDTFVKYNFYFSKMFGDLSKYDSRGFEHFPTEKLYAAILTLLNNLVGDLVYEEIRQGSKVLGCVLFKKETVLYKIVDEPKKGLFAPKIKKDTKTFNLGKLKEKA